MMVIMSQPLEALQRGTYGAHKLKVSTAATQCKMQAGDFPVASQSHAPLCPGKGGEVKGAPE
jgi:hypothetical protein